MTYLKLFTTNARGRTCLQRTEPNSAMARALLDKAAFAALSEAGIVAAHIEVVEALDIKPKARTYR